MQNKIIMPQATALWLKKNTKLTLEQISCFCELDLLTIDSLEFNLAQSHNPIKSGQLTLEEVEKGEKDPKYRLKNSLNLSEILPSQNSRKYIPMAYQKQKPEMICWFLNKLNTTELSDFQKKKIAKVLSTNFNFVSKTIAEIQKNPDLFKKILDPVQISICSQKELDEIRGSP
jgi:hypothetical protein